MICSRLIIAAFYMVSMKVIIDAIMSADSEVVKNVDAALMRKSVPLEQSRYARDVICLGIDDKKALLTALKVMSVMPVSDLISMLSPIYSVHSRSIDAVFEIEDEKSHLNFKRVIRSINGIGLVTNSLNDRALNNLKRALRKEDE